MDRQPVTSGHVKAVGYDTGTRELEVEFRDGAVYVYRGVPAETFRGLVEAPSAGKYLHAEIRGRYPASRK